MKGWIWLHRKIRDNWIWEDPVKLKWWLDILLQVNHDEKIKKVNIGLHIIDCGRGQSIMSLQNWAERWNVSKGCARHFLTLLQNDKMIVMENVKKSTRITVCNFDYYNKPAHARETTGKRPVNDRETHGDPNNNDNKDLITINNEKNVFSEKVDSFFNSFLQEQKKPLSENRIATLVENLEKLSLDDDALKIEIIKQAISGGYADFRPIPGRKPKVKEEFLHLGPKSAPAEDEFIEFVTGLGLAKVQAVKLYDDMCYNKQWKDRNGFSIIDKWQEYFTEKLNHGNI